MKKLIALILSAVLLIPAAGNISAAADMADQKTADVQKTSSDNSIVIQEQDSPESAAVGESVVFFTSDISPDGMMDVYQALNWKPTGNVAVKLSTGEPPASNYLRPELIRDLVQSVKGTIVECNTAYGGSRTETAMHMQVAKDHGFTDIADVDILDADGSMELPVRGGSRLSENLVGSHFGNYDSYIVLSHFKGHAMAGFGGAIKNISIGLGSKEGKCLIHTGGRSHTSPWGGDQTAFTESMAEAGKSVSDYLSNGSRIVYVNVLNNISIDCDCDGNPAEPDIHDIGILASTDPVAIDQASIDLCFAAEGSGSLQQRVSRQNGLHTLEHAQEIGLGSRTYSLKDIAEISEEETEGPKETEPETEKPEETETETEKPEETETVTERPEETEPETEKPKETEPEAEKPGETNPETETSKRPESESENTSGSIPGPEPPPEPETIPDSKPAQPSQSKTENKAEQNAKKEMARVTITKFKVKSTGKRKISVSWKKVSKVKGYQVQISSVRNFRNSKIIFSKFLAKNSINISKGKLKSGKTYYVRTRAFTTYRKKGKTVKAYSKWSTGSGKVKVL